MVPSIPTDPSVSALAALLHQTPPGQVAKVYHDLRVLLEATGVPGAGEQLRAAAWPVLSAYNTHELITVKNPAASGAETDAVPAPPLIISEAGALVDSAESEEAVRFVDPRAQASYAFDPLRLRLSDPQPIVVNDAYERLRSALDAAATKYTGHYYQDGMTSTFVQIAPAPELPSAVAAEPTGPSVPSADEAAPTMQEPASEVVSEVPTPSEAASETVETTELSPARPEAHAGGSADVQAVTHAQHEVRASESEAGQHDVAGQGDRSEVDPSVASGVEAAVSQAQAAAEPDAQAEETAEEKQPAENKEQAANHDEALAEAVEQTHIDPESAEGAEPEAKAGATTTNKTHVGEAPVEEAGDASADQIRGPQQTPLGAPTFTIHIVGNRYNLANFWAGRWRSTYVLSLPSAIEAEKMSSTEAGVSVQGKVQVQVHYFEEGNVQLAAEHAPQLGVQVEEDLVSILSGSAAPEAYSSLADAVLRAVKADEQAYHAALEGTLDQLSERTFRALRRQLPVTKQKLDWNRAVSYSLAGDLTR